MNKEQRQLPQRIFENLWFVKLFKWLKNECKTMKKKLVSCRKKSTEKYNQQHQYHKKTHKYNTYIKKSVFSNQSNNLTKKNKESLCK